jgi:hypothetical protein
MNMPNRAERREAERLARKLAFQEARNKPPQAAAPGSLSEAQLAANRANAQHSTGPLTPEGRAISSRNALKAGLTGRTVLLPTDDAAEYNRRLDSALACHAPETEEEQILVQSLVDIDWRLNRIVSLESGIYAKGTLEFADAHTDQPAAHRALLIQAEVYLKYEKPLRNLHIQEARLQRQRAKNLADLKRLKAERATQEPAPEKANAAAAANGFEFSTPEFSPTVFQNTVETTSAAPSD